MKICYYITSHGFGHACRSFAIIRELLKKDIEIVIRSNLPKWLVKNSFKDKKIKYKNKLITLKVFHNPDLTLQYEKTFQYFDYYCRSYNRIIKEEVKFCKKSGFDLIISDIEPTAFEIAEICHINSAAISNFTWYDIYKAIFPSKTRVLDRIKKSYEKASLLFRLPFSFKMTYFKETEIIDVPVVFRRLTRTSEEIRFYLDISSNIKIILIQFGAHVLQKIKNLYKKLFDYQKKHPEIIFVVNRFSNVGIPDSYKSAFKIIPDLDTEIQDYVNACDLLIGKTGYSLCSETIGYEVPFFYTCRDYWKEDEHLKKGIENYGIGKFYPISQIFDGNWLNDIEEGFELRNKKPKKTINKFGQDFIGDFIIKKLNKL